MNEPGLTEREKVAIRSKSAELAVQMWATPGTTDFNVTAMAKGIGQYILDGTVAEKGWQNHEH